MTDSRQQLAVFTYERIIFSSLSRLTGRAVTDTLLPRETKTEYRRERRREAGQRKPLQARKPRRQRAH